MRRFLFQFAVRVALVAALFALAPGLTSKAFAQAGVEVRSLDFDGNQRYDEDTLRLALRTKIGQRLDRALLQEDINTLYGFFDTVELEEEQTPDGIKLLFLVTENPVVRLVKFSGLGSLSETEVRAVIETAKGRPLAEFRVENDLRKILRLYRQKGFHFVEVESDVTDAVGGKDVVFTVREGPSVSVDEVVFEGNKSRTASELGDNMATSGGGFLGLGASDFVEETLRLDLLTLRNYYRSEGWLDAAVDLVDLDFTDDREDVIIRIAVTEGPTYKVGNVSVKGAENYPGGTEKLMPLLRVIPGKRRRQQDVSNSIDALETAYREEGYFAVRVVSKEELPAEGATVDLVFTIEEQAKVRVRNLDILGNTITQDKVLRREISLTPGGVLNQNEIDKSLNRLRSLRFFNGVRARVKDIDEGGDPNERDVVFEVEDGARTGQLRFAAGASSDLGFIGSVTVTKRNFDWKDTPERFGDIFNGRAFTGAGQTMTLELAPGSDLSSYRLAFSEPWLFDKPISFGWDLFYSKFSRFDYDSERKGVNFSLGRRWTIPGKQLDSVLGLTGTTRIESQEVNGIDRDAAPTAFLAEESLSLIAERLTLRLDRVDNSADPSTGWYAQGSTEVGFIGDVQLWKNSIEAKRYWVLMRDDEERDHVFSLGASFAYAKALSGSVDADPNLFGETFVPIYERYRAGGSSTVRGFSYGGAGPHGSGDPRYEERKGEEGKPRKRNIRLAETTLDTLDNDGDPLGGNVLFTTSAEYQFPMFSEVLRGVLFVDAGMVRDDFDSSHGLESRSVDSLQRELANGGSKRERRLARQINFDDGPSFFSDVRIAVGFGFRIKIPIFGQQPIALDFGFPISSESGDDTQILSFSIARDF